MRPSLEGRSLEAPIPHRKTSFAGDFCLGISPAAGYKSTTWRAGSPSHRGALVYASSSPAQGWLSPFHWFPPAGSRGHRYRESVATSRRFVIRASSQKTSLAGFYPPVDGNHVNWKQTRDSW